MLWRGQDAFSGLVLLFDIPWSGRVCPMLCGLCIWLCFMSIRVHLRERRWSFGVRRWDWLVTAVRFKFLFIGCV